MQDLSIFSHLPQISSQPSGIHWTIDPKLHRYIQQLDHPNVEAIAYYLVTAPPSPINNACLTAFLAHVAFVPAHRLRATHALLQQYYTEDITDLYQLGLEIICEPRKFLSNFDVTRLIDTGYWYPNFYKWSQRKFDLRLIDKIRSQEGISGFRRTNLGLATRATPTKIVKALTHQGYPVATHPTYLALQSCLKKAVKAKRFDTANPQPVHYAEILALYRQRKVIALDADGIVSYLDQLGSAVSNYDRLRVTSIDLPLTKDGDSTLLNTIADPTNPIDTAVLTEYQQQVDRVKTIFTNLLQQLSIDSDRILLLFNGLNFTQREVGIELECNQATAMRRHNRILAKLAQDLHQQINPQAPIPALKSETLNQIIPQVVDLCQHYYSDPLKEIMIPYLSIMDIDTDRLLLLFYGLGLRPVQVSRELKNQSMVQLCRDRVIGAIADDIRHHINQNSALPPLSTTHEEDPIFKQTIVYFQQYYRDLLADTIRKFENQEPQMIIDRVQSRWQIQFTQEKTVIVDGEPRITYGHALKALNKIINKKT
jgi:hypothetical protein